MPRFYSQPVKAGPTWLLHIHQPPQSDALFGQRPGEGLAQSTGQSRNILGSTPLRCHPALLSNSAPDGQRADPGHKGPTRAFGYPDHDAVRARGPLKAPRQLGKTQPEEG